MHFVFVQENTKENGDCALMHPILHTFDTAYAENNKRFSFKKAFGKYLPMQYDLSVLRHHVSVRPFFGRLKSPGFSSLYRTPKKCPFCKKSVIIECLDLE